VKAQGTPAISIQNVAKQFGNFCALDNVSLDIAPNEFFTLLGPSGCGKTTLLRMIAGFETASQGKIFLYEEEIEKLPANRRSVNTVFQQYALFPHMTVAENVGFGLRMLKVPKHEIGKRVSETLSMVQLSEFSHRYPSQLSGGQQQRVALARALAPKPKVLLLDEPLSALDLKLRQSMRAELKRIQRQTGITFVFVTHDQEEALTMSDRIAVMSAGKLRQVGSAKDIYERPNSVFVANFIGETNLIDVKVDSISGSVAKCRLADGSTIVCTAEALAANPETGKISVRPERIRLGAPNSEGIKAVVTQSTYLGTDTQHTVRLSNGEELTIRSQNHDGPDTGYDLGKEVSVVIEPGVARLLGE
jgi:spermidine/putrescine transport system ATP-binding protein